MATAKRFCAFAPHGTARAESSAGAALASFRARLSAYPIDLLLSFAAYVPAVAGLQHLLIGRLHLTDELYQYFLHPNHCCVHDRIAETIVVKSRKRAGGETPAGQLC